MDRTAFSASTAAAALRSPSSTSARGTRRTTTRARASGKRGAALERSHAVKCPSVAQQLAGTKKVQQALALPDALTRFVAPERAAELRSCFARLDGLDVDGGSAVSEAVAAGMRGA